MEGIRNFKGKKVFITGHTGFKGSWLCAWLLELGAKITGYALAPKTEPALFDELKLEKHIEHIIADVNDLERLKKAITTTQPDYVFHLAAQAIVRESYQNPLETLNTNIIGIANLLEALRGFAKKSKKNISTIIVTTDKCYHNREWLHSYRETDRLGGHDPYSASKAAAEIVTASWRQSFQNEMPNIKIATARAGNVIGGGDWSADRIIPDAWRAKQKGKKLIIRNPKATRPWQHVLEPLSAYLHLALALNDKEICQKLDSDPSGFAFNFGPELEANRSVEELIEAFNGVMPINWESPKLSGQPHEASLLNLAIDKARHLLGWRPLWNFDKAVEQSALWYKRYDYGEAAINLTRQQILNYNFAARKAGLTWALEN